MTKAVLISGATGKQGGAVINALLSENADFEILAVTRNAKSAPAQKLLQKSPKVKLVEGNLEDPAAIFENAKQETSGPIWGVFSVQVRLLRAGPHSPLLTSNRFQWALGRRWKLRSGKGRPS
jgi:hypothetical protein